MSVGVQPRARRVANASAPGGHGVPRRGRVSVLRQVLLGLGASVTRVWVPLRLRITAMSSWLTSALAPALRRLAPVLSTFTTIGRWTAVTAVTCAVVGLWCGWAEPAAVTLVLLVSLLIAVAFVLGRPQYDVRVDLATVRVVVGERAVGAIRVRNAAERSAPPSLIELPVGRALASFAVPRLDPGQIHEELFTIPTQRRAVLTMGPVRSVRRDPLELLHRQVNWTEPEEIYVHPRTARLENSSTGFVRDLEGLATKDLSNDDVSFHALREYVPGDDLRYVHWRSTARMNRLMIRQFEETRRSQFVIVLSTRLADYADEDEFELAISCAASLSRSAHADGKEVTVFTSDAKLPTPTPVRLMDAYSSIEPSTGIEPFGDRVRVVAAEAPGASVVALVTGSAMPLEQLRLASVRIPSMASCFGVRAATAEQLSRKGVGDFDLVSLPTLENLPLAIRVVTG